MVRNVFQFAITLVAAAVLNGPSQAAPLEKTTLDAMVTRFAAAESVPEELVRRVIKRESRGNPRVVSQGNYGLMQIKLPTARSMGYSGNAAGLLDAETNMTYAVKYLAGAWHVAHGSIDRAVHYYAAGYYYAAKHEGGAKTASGASVNAVASADLPPRDNSALMSH